MRTREKIETLFYDPDPGDEVFKSQWRRNLELEVMLDIRDLLARMNEREIRRSAKRSKP